MKKRTSMWLGLVVLALAGCGAMINSGGGSFVNEGATGAGGPLVLSLGKGHGGQVAANGKSYYQVTTAAAGPYSIILNNLTDNANPSIFTDNGFTAATGRCLVFSGTAMDSCSVTTAAVNTVIYIMVSDISGNGESFTLTAVGNEGAMGPGGQIVLAKDTAYGGQVAAAGNSYYQVTYPAAGTYTIALNNLTNDADPYTFTDNAFSMATGTCTNYGGTKADTCTVTTGAANTVIYIKVSDWVFVGETFTLTP
ncbi:MAG: PPC domain-containing protein [Deltaproteobacteria bacterium]|nr:PPC domain-containing protein [Deltaproteobacteria bacterium]